MPTELLLSPHSATPMYAQIVEQVVAKVMTGEWKAGDALPSIRELAGNSQVSVITVKRAYLELEHAGVLTTRQGRGTFVSENVQLQQDLREQELDGHLARAAEVGRELGLGTRELEQRLRRVVRDRDENR